MSLTFPGNCDTAEKKLAYTLRAKRLITDVRNALAIWARDGITEDEYNNGVPANTLDNISQLTVLPSEVKTMYPYKDGFDDTKLVQFAVEEYTPRCNGISLDFAQQRAIREIEIANLTTWDGDIEIMDLPTMEF